MNVCYKCGHEVSEGEKYCGGCGILLDQSRLIPQEVYKITQQNEIEELRRRGIRNMLRVFIAIPIIFILTILVLISIYAIKAHRFSNGKIMAVSIKYYRDNNDYIGFIEKNFIIDYFYNWALRENSIKAYEDVLFIGGLDKDEEANLRYKLIPLIRNNGPFPEKEGYIVDKEHNIKYRWVKIGNQIWLGEDAINPEPENIGMIMSNEYLFYLYELHLYEAPYPWRVATHEDWLELENYLGLGAYSNTSFKNREIFREYYIRVNPRLGVQLIGPSSVTRLNLSNNSEYWSPVTERERKYETYLNYNDEVVRSCSEHDYQAFIHRGASQISARIRFVSNVSEKEFLKLTERN
ncbi:zinc ribbon domain-containing protein [Candidatus Dojkabacteria bacterium]|nr:zinc ribbon domain-containing protein [Candidatus Dojkabacteria bacterium]